MRGLFVCGILCVFSGGGVVFFGLLEYGGWFSVLVVCFFAFLVCRIGNRVGSSEVFTGGLLDIHLRC